MSYSCFSCPNHSCLCSLHTPSTPVHCCIWPCKYPNTANAEVKHANNGKREKNWGGARQMAAASSIHGQCKGSKTHLLFWTLDQFCSEMISNLFELTNHLKPNSTYISKAYSISNRITKEHYLLKHFNIYESGQCTYIQP